MGAKPVKVQIQDKSNKNSKNDLQNCLKYQIFHNMLLKANAHGPAISSTFFFAKMLDPSSNHWEKRMLKGMKCRRANQSYAANSKSINQIRTDITTLTLLKQSHRTVTFYGVLFQNPNYIQDKHFFENQLKLANDSALLILQYCDGGSLQQKIKKNPQFFTEDVIMDYICQIVEGLNHFFEKGILHRDLRTCNILIHHSQLKIIDFDSAFIYGISTYEDIRNGLQLKKNTPSQLLELVSMPLDKIKQFTNKELFQKQKKCDIYYLGILIYNMVCKREYDNQLQDDCIRKSLIKMSGQNNKKAIYIMNRCLQQHPNNRIELKDLTQYLARYQFSRYLLIDQIERRCYLCSQQGVYLNSYNADDFTQRRPQQIERIQIEIEQIMRNGMLLRHTQRCTRMLNNKYTPQQLIKITEQSFKNDSREQLSSLTDKFISQVQTHIVYYQYLFQLLIPVEGYSIKMELVTILEFLLDQITRYPFKQDKDYVPYDHSYLLRKLQTKTKELFAKKQFFMNRSMQIKRLLNQSQKQYVDNLQNKINQFNETIYSNEDYHSFKCEYFNFKSLLIKLDLKFKNNIHTFLQKTITQRNKHTQFFKILMLVSQDLNKMLIKDVLIIKRLFESFNKATFNKGQLQNLFLNYLSQNQQSQTLQHFEQQKTQKQQIFEECQINNILKRKQSIEVEQLQLIRQNQQNKQDKVDEDSIIMTPNQLLSNLFH